MITGVGTDIVEISRIGRALKRGKGFASRVFTEAEQEYCSATANSDQRFAGRFAAKEAVAKALGTSLSWQDVEILPDESGKPLVTMYNKAAEVAKGLRVLVSISHCGSHAIAYATAESD
ncbi:MAG TPA: holo-ACP synthase [Armatimonadota bacterium]|jgi:holo-[acyl-carrier protein] synthase